MLSEQLHGRMNWFKASIANDRMATWKHIPTAEQIK